MKTGIFVDVSNISMNGGRHMRYDTLLEFASRGGYEAVRLNAYASFDQERAKFDQNYKIGQSKFHGKLRDFGYKVIVKETKWYTDEFGSKTSKSNADLDLAVDALLQSKNLDRVVLVTGDGDFVQVVKALQNSGCQVEVVAFDNVSGELRNEVDVYTSGYLIPNLLPQPYTPEAQPEWGEIGSLVRGVVIHHDDEKKYGFFRYLKTHNGKLWITDGRDEDSPYSTIFFSDNDLTERFDFSITHKRNHVFEFVIAEGRDNKTKATNIRVINART